MYCWVVLNTNAGADARVGPERESVEGGLAQGWSNLNSVSPFVAFTCLMVLFDVIFAPLLAPLAPSVGP